MNQPKAFVRLNVCLSVCLVVRTLHIMSAVNSTYLRLSVCLAVIRCTSDLSGGAVYAFLCCSIALSVCRPFLSECLSACKECLSVCLSVCLSSLLYHSMYVGLCRLSHRLNCVGLSVFFRPVCR